MNLQQAHMERITRYSKVVIVLLLVTTAVIGYGATEVSSSSSFSQFQSDSPEFQANEYITNNFTAADENVTSVQVIVRNTSGNVLSKPSLLRSLQYQQELVDSPAINQTLAEDNPITGVSNLVALAALQQQQAAAGGENASAGGQQDGQADGQQAGSQQDGQASGQQGAAMATQPSLARQIAVLEEMSPEQVDRTVAALFGNGDGGSSNIALRLMPTGFEPTSMPVTAEARSMLITQDSTGTEQAPGGLGDTVTDAQLEMQDIGEAQAGDEYVTFGFGIISDEINRSQSDSLTLVGPLALLFVIIALAVAYRDLLDILLGAIGILLVLVWTFGFMGWMDIQFNQVMIAVPVLLIGLSIDYAIHIFMRHREQRDEDSSGTRKAMATALAGVGVALIWVTATSVIGFLSNLASALPPIQDFGIVSAFGILAALAIFGALIPALKVETDELLERFGFDRRKPAFGTGGGRLSSVLAVGSKAAKRAPVAVVVVALLLTITAGAAGSQVSTSFEQEDFLADDPPDWMKDLPEPLAPSDYSAKENLGYVNENFQREDSQSQVLIRGDVATAAGLDRIHAIEQAAAESDVTYVLPNGQADVTGPVGTMQAVAAAQPNSTFARLYASSNTDSDPAPDENVTAVLDAFNATAPQAAQNVLYSEGDSYEAARVVVATKGTASPSDVTDETRAIASAGAGGAGVTAIATGSTVVNQVVTADLFDSVIESLAISLVAVFLFLMVAYRITEGSFSLGAVTLMPVALSVAWILGTMYAVGVPFNVLTGTITSLTIGLGVAYSIHVSERYKIELERQGDVWDAMNTAVTGTGGALLGSAATTVGGFGTLAIAILPPLRQFGIITGLTIIYAFLASVLVLPSLLVLWTRYVSKTEVPSGDEEPGGRPAGGDE